MSSHSLPNSAALTQVPSSLSATTPLQVRSPRSVKWFWIDNAVIDTYGPTLGPIGLALYMGLCRYANAKTGTCWPSLGTLSTQIGISVISASRHLKTLVTCGLIHVETRPGTTALITILDIPESPITEIGVSGDPQLCDNGPPSESLDPSISVGGEQDSPNQTKEPAPPNPPECARAEKRGITPQPEPLHTTLETLLAQWDEAVRTRLYDRARTALVAEGVSPWHLILPVIETRMLALWEAETQDRGARQRQEAAA